MESAREFDLKGMVHIAGEPASGKTLFAICYASKISSHADVLWVNTNGKIAFIESLKRTISQRNGRLESVKVLTALGHKMVRKTLGNIPSHLTQDTGLVVIDSITRVLDMGLRSEPMWGRVLFEEILPSLTAIAMTHNLTILCISECRNLGGSERAVYENAINRFADYEISVARTRKSGVSVARIASKSLAEICLKDGGAVALALEGGE